MNSLETPTATHLRITCRSEELAEKLGIVGRGVSTRQSVHVLTGILLRATEGRLELAATDMELSVRLGIDATVGSEGRVVVPGRLFVDIAKPAAARRGDARARRRRGARAADLRRRLVQPAHVQRRGLPAPAGARGGEEFAVDRTAFLDTIAKVEPLGVA